MLAFERIFPRCIFLLLALCVVVCLCKPSRPKGEGLYLYTDKMQLLNMDTLDKFLQHSKTAWIVEFYSSWCGHCQHYAPTWKKLAEELYGWRNVVRVGAIDCADEKNTPACRNYQVMRYPTVRLFPPGMTSNKFTGVDIPLPSNLKNSEIRRKVADYVEEVRVKYSASHFPDLDFLPDSSELPTPKSRTKVQAVVFEWEPVDDSSGNDDSSLDVGRTAVLDASVLGDVVQVFRARATHPLYGKFDMMKTPSVLFLDAVGGRERSRLVGDDEVTAARVAATLRELVPDAAEDAPGYNEEGEEFEQLHSNVGTMTEADDEDNEVLKSSLVDRHVYLEDVTSAVRYSLLHEVALHPRISGDSLKALSAFVSVLGSYFPGEDRLRFDLQKLATTIADESVVTSDEWLRLVEPIFRNVHEVKFVGCAGSQPKYRGYPCSLWTLFHAMTVEAVVGGDDSRHRDVVEGVHGFVKHFFSCRYCSKHFDEMYRDSSGEVKNLRSGVMWLWLAHNKVNRRLAGDISEDPRHPKVQFPSSDLCPDCFDEVTSRWREDRVYSFLLSHYGRANFKTASSRALAAVSAEEEDRRRRKQHWIDGEDGHSLPSSSSSSSSGLLFSLVDYFICSAMGLIAWTAGTALVW